MDAAAEYNRLLEADPAAAVEQAGRLEEAFRAGGITFDGTPMPTFLRPHFVPRPDWDRLRADGRRLLELAARVARHAFEGDVGRLCAFLGTPAAEARWVRIDPGEPDVVWSRLDAFLTPEGPRFIEINSDAPAGFGYGDRMARLFQDLSAFRELARRRRVRYVASGPPLLRAMVDLWRRRGGSGTPVLAVVDWTDVKTRADQEILREEFEAEGVTCLRADPRELEARGGRLLAAGRAVDVVYRRAVLSELLEREDEVRAFLEAYRDGRALFVNSFRCRLSEDKAFLAVLTDEAFAPLLSEDEHAFVAAVAPWTRKLADRRTRRQGREIDLLPHVIESREQLVIKPAHAYGGRSVFLGDQTDPARWERAVRAGLGEAWVVQERVIIPEETFPVVSEGRLLFEPRKVNTNPFYVRGAEVGAVTRASRSAVINVSAGGGSVPTFVVD